MDFIATIAMKAVRAYLNHTIGRFTADDLRNAIDQNMDLWSNTPDAIRQKGAFFKGRWIHLLHKHVDQINTQLLVNWLHEDHPHLCMVITSSMRNYRWFDKQVKTIKHEILRMRV